MSKIEITKNNRGDYTAEINLNQIHTFSIGSVYAYGDTELRAVANLGNSIESLIE